MERIKLDLVPSCIKPVLHASQYDDGRQWQCDILNGGTPYVFQNGDTVELNLRKGDGLVVTSAVAVVPGQSYVILVSTEQMCAIYGSNLGELKLKSNGVDIGSCNFILEVEKDTTGGDKKSMSQIYDLQAQVDDCTKKALENIGANGLPFDPDGTDLESTNTEDAIKEVDSKIDGKADSDSVYTKEEVNQIIDDLPEAMIFKGTLGVGGTITALPTASAENEGYTYKVITAGTYAGQSADVGDMFTSNGSEWVLIPAGDEDSYTREEADQKFATLTDLSSKANTASVNNIYDEFDIVVSPNLLDMNSIASGILNSSGAVEESASYYTTDYISANANNELHYQFKYNNVRYDNTAVPGYTNIARVCAYNASKEFISGSYASAVTSYTAPAGTAYIRVSLVVNASFSERALLIQNTANVVPYSEYGSIVSSFKDEAEPKLAQIDEISTHFVKSPNLLNLDTMHDGKYIGTKGDLTDNANYIATDYIPVEQGDVVRYQFNYNANRYDATAVNYTQMSFVAAYDANYNFITGSHASSQKSYTCPTGAKFFRASFPKSSFNSGYYSQAELFISDVATVIPFTKYGSTIGMDDKIYAYLPGDVYCAVGRTIEFYNDQVCVNADKYHLQWICTVGQALERKFSVTGSNNNTGDYALVLCVYNDNYELLWQGKTTLHIVEELSLANAFTICPIGDSLTNGKQWLAELMNLSGDMLQFVGTYSKTANDSDGNAKTFSHEGRSGFSAQNYILGTAYTYSGATETPHNKFWDGTKFSWSHYKTTYSINPDAVMIWLGVNGLCDDNTLNANYIKEMVDAIRDNDANIPIFILNTIFKGNQNGIGKQTSSDGFSASTGVWNYQEKMKIQNLMITLDNLLKDYQGVTTINLALSHDSEYNFGAVSTPVNPRASQTELMPSEAIHPQPQGYFQCADIIYSVLSAKVSE